MDQIPCRLSKLFKAGFSPVNVILQALSICLQEKRRLHSVRNAAEKIPLRIINFVIAHCSQRGNWMVINTTAKQQCWAPFIFFLLFLFSSFPPPAPPLFALAGNQHASAWWRVFMSARWRSSSLSRAELSLHYGHSAVTWSCCLQGRFDFGLTLIFGQSKLSCSYCIKQLKWKATPAVRPLWLLFCCTKLK